MHFLRVKKQTTRQGVYIDYNEDIQIRPEECANRVRNYKTWMEELWACFVMENKF